MAEQVASTVPEKPVSILPEHDHNDTPAVLDDIMKTVHVSPSAVESVMMAKLGLLSLDGARQRVKVPLESPDKRMAQRQRERLGKTEENHVLRQPYLDRISVAQHTPNLTTETWRDLLIQPVSIPGLTHTGLTCAFVSWEDEPLIRPDGGRTGQLSTIVKQSVRAYQADSVQESFRVKGVSELPSVPSVSKSNRAQRWEPPELKTIESKQRTDELPGSKQTTHLPQTINKAKGRKSKRHVKHVKHRVLKHPDLQSANTEHCENTAHPVGATQVLVEHAMRAQARVRTTKDAVSQLSHNMVKDQRLPNKAKQSIAAPKGSSAYERYEQSRRDRLAGAIEIRGNSRAIFESMLSSIYD